jgi:thioredoxin-related protein
MKYSILASILFISSFAIAQDPKQFKSAQDEGWLVNIEEAYKISKKTNKPIMANFTGSDWCGWCKRLRAEVFSQPEFKKWAKENVVLLELDYPRKSRLPEQQTQQNAGLQQAFQVTGFPTIWVFDLDKPNNDEKFELRAYGKTGYLRGGASNYTKELDKMVARKSDS